MAGIIDKKSHGLAEDKKVKNSLSVSKKLRPLLLLTILFSISLSAQPDPVVLTVKEQSVEGNSYLFSIYLKADNLNNGHLYLANADFIFTFNSGNFTNPSISKEGSVPGHCTFVPTDQSGNNILFTRAAYYSGTTTEIQGNKININLSPPTPGDQNSFDTRIAKIGTEETHTLGRFRITGLNAGASADLQWYTGSGISTKVLSYENVPDFDSHLVNIVTEMEDCPDVLTVVDNPIPNGMYAANQEVNSSKVVEYSATVTFSSGNHINLNSGFEVPLGAIFVATMDGCP